VTSSRWAGRPEARGRRKFRNATFLNLQDRNVAFLNLSGFTHPFHEGQ
jgi:hypothetical protein